MGTQVYSAPSQTEGRKKAFFEWKSIDLSYELSLTCGGNVNYYKSVHHPIPTRGNREHPGNFQNKSVSSPFSWVSRYIPFLAKWRGEEGFCWKVQGRGHTVRLSPRALGCHIRYEKVSPFVKFEIILLLLCFLLDSLQISTYKLALQDIKFYDKFADRFQDVSKVKSPAGSKAKV